MYYNMSLPELLILVFIIFLWVVSIMFCIKRFEKISTVERTSFNNDYKLKLNAYQQVPSAKLYQTHSYFNSNSQIPIMNRNNSSYIENSCSLDELNNKSKKKSSTFTNDQLKETFLYNTSPLYENEMSTNYNEILPNSNFNNSSNSFQSKPNNVRKSLSCPYSLNLSCSSISCNKLKKNIYMNKSANYFTKTSFFSASAQLTKSILSINDIKTKLGNTEFTDNIIYIPQINKNNEKKMLRNSKTRTIQQSLNQDNEYNSSRFNLQNRQNSINKPELIDPKKIPKFIQKSFIDLHKKSMLNLAHKNYNSDIRQLCTRKPTTAV